MPIERKCCSACGRHFDHLVGRRWNAELSSYDSEERLAVHGDDPADLDCPDCGSSDYTQVLVVGQGIHLGGEAGVGRDFPYFDRALGVRVESYQHRAKLMEERGLVAVDGDLDIMEEHNRRRRQDEADQAEFDEMIREQYEGPDKAEYLRARDMIAEHGLDLWERQGR